MSTATRATIDDLMRVEYKAELINGKVVQLMSSGHRPTRIGFRIAMRLEDHAITLGRGVAYPDGMGFRLPELPSGRESFSPNASYYVGPLPANVDRFVDGPPTFAAEVRSDNDYGPAADAEYADKRVDYFAAGTLVVWDVNPRAGTVTLYRAADPLTPVVFRRGETADAEPAVPGWRVAVDDLFNV